MPINSIYSYDGNTLTLIENLSVQWQGLFLVKLELEKLMFQL
jgi:hypothetical protein